MVRGLVLLLSNKENRIFTEIYNIIAYPISDIWCHLSWNQSVLRDLFQFSINNKPEDQTEEEKLEKRISY